MSKKIGLIVTLVGICALSLFLLNCGGSSSRPSGVLYVLTQGSNGFGNNVSSFAIDLDTGTLGLVNSNASTCPTQATPTNSEPCGLPLDILLDPAGATAFVLDQGVPSASIAPAIFSYTVNSDGSLGSPNPAATLTGNLPLAMTRDATGQFLFVLDGGSSPLPPNCPPVGSSNPTYTGCPSISTFAISSASLAPASGSPFYIGRAPTALSAITFPVPNGVVNAPCGATTTEEFVFVTSNHDLSPEHNDNALSLYCLNSSGSLSDLTPDPPYTPAVDPISVMAVNTTPVVPTTGGIFVYVGSQPSASGALSIFQMCTQVGNGQCSAQNVTNALLLPVTTPAPPATGQNPVEMVVDPTNNFLYVLCYLSNQVWGYHIGTTAGTLTALAPANQPTGSQPVSMALHPSVNNTGQFLFVSNSNSDNITGFTLGTTSGSMSSPTTTIAPAAPSGIAVH